MIQNQGSGLHMDFYQLRNESRYDLGISQLTHVPMQS